MINIASFTGIKLDVYVGLASVLVTGMVFCTVASTCILFDKDRGSCLVLAFKTHVCLFVESDPSFFFKNGFDVAVVW